MAHDHRTEKRKRGLALAAGTVTAVAAMGLFLLPGCSFGGSPDGTSSGAVASLEQVLAPSTSIGGVDVSGMNREQALQAVSAAQEPAPAYRLTLKLADKTWELTEQDMTFDRNVEQVVEQAFADLNDPASSGERTYPLEAQVNYSKLDETLKSLAKEMNIQPVDATVSSFNSSTGTFSFQDGKNGLTVKEDELCAAVREALSGSTTATVDVPYTEVPFDKTAAQIKSNMQKLGTYSTVSTNTANGNHNMKLALASVNGTVLQPGEIFSFNGTTGNTTNGSLGYKKAGAIVGGKMVDEYGGGICQASTTVYGAALRSNMKILTRYNHAWPSTYCPIGQDAAVDYGNLDFRFQNVSSYPVYIVAGMSGTTLTVTFYGYQDPSYDEIRVTSQQTGTIAQPADVYQQSNSLEKGKIVKQRSGRSGKRATAQRVYYKNGAVVKTEQLNSSYYRELATIYQYGPGTTVPTNGSDPTSSTPESSSTVSSETSSENTSSAPSSSETPSSSSIPSSAPVSSMPSSTPSSEPVSTPASEPASAVSSEPSSASSAPVEPASSAPSSATESALGETTEPVAG